MKNFKLLLCIAFIAAFFSIAKSQTANTYTSYTGGFSINLPDDIRGKGSNGTAGGVYFSWHQPEAEYTAGFYEIEGLPSAKIDGVFSYDEMVRMYFNKFSAQGEKIHDKEISLQGVEGREYKYKTSASIFILRLFIAEDRLYQLQAEIALKNQAKEDEVLQVFDSFRFLEREKVKEFMAKQLADAMPQTLPQTPVVPKLKTDLHDRNLKGNVKDVFTEFALYGLKNSLRKKQPRIFEEFNSDGNLLKTVEYDSFGNASTVRVLGYVAGKRVARMRSISNDTDMGGILLDFPPNAKPDKRFDESYTYKYVGENLTEERTFFSNGVLYRRSISRFLKNKKEQSYDDGSGKPFQKIVFTLDEKGNEIEISVTSTGGMFGKKTERFKVEYESFDDKGNWTKRNISQWYGLDDKTGSFQPSSIEYRTINYFQ